MTHLSRDKLGLRDAVATEAGRAAEAEFEPGFV